MILDTMFRLLYLVLWLFDVALVIYVLMSWLRPTASRLALAAPTLKNGD